jgi:hypothetical protein
MSVILVYDKHYMDVFLKIKKPHETEQSKKINFLIKLVIVIN